MEAIQSFATRVNQSFERISAAVTAVAADIDGLKQKIEALQSSPGTLTPEDQAALDEIEAAVNATATRLDALDQATEAVPTPQ